MLIVNNAKSCELRLCKRICKKSSDGLKFGVRTLLARFNLMSTRMGIGKNTKNNACKNSLPYIIAVDAQKLERKASDRIDIQCLVNWYFCTKRVAKNFVTLLSSNNSSSLFFVSYHALY